MNEFWGWGIGVWVGPHATYLWQSNWHTDSIIKYNKHLLDFRQCIGKMKFNNFKGCSLWFYEWILKLGYRVWDGLQLTTVIVCGPSHKLVPQPQNSYVGNNMSQNFELYFANIFYKWLHI